MGFDFEKMGYLQIIFVFCALDVQTVQMVGQVFMVT